MKGKIKNKWYARNWVKGFLIAAAHALAVILIISMVWVVAYPEESWQALEGKRMPRYEDSSAFQNKLFSDMTSILWIDQRKDLLLDNGEINQDKIIDIKEYSESGVVSGEAVSGLSYKLGQLEEWGKALNDGLIKSSDYGEESDDPIIVCKKTDGTFSYYYYSEFREKIDSGEFSFIMETDGYSSQDILYEMKNGNWYEGQSDSNYAVLGDSGQILYVNCWNYDGFWMEEWVSPRGAESLLELVNENPQWNGRLEEAYQMILNCATDIVGLVEQYEEAQATWQEGNTNLVYIFADKEAKQIKTNRAEYADFAQLESSLEDIKKKSYYIQVMPKLRDFETNLDGVTATLWQNELPLYIEAEEFVCLVGIDSSYPIQDSFYKANKEYEKYAPKAMPMLALLFSSAIFLLVIVVFLTLAAGRHPNDNEIHLNWFDKWKTELGAGAVIGLWIGIVALLGITMDALHMGYYEIPDGQMYYYRGITFESPAEFVLIGMIGAVSCSFFLIGYMSLVRRIKARTLWKNSILKWLFVKVSYLFRQIPIVWGRALVFGIFLLSQWVIFGSGSGFMAIVGFAAAFAAFVYVLGEAIGKDRIRKGLQRIAGGEVDYKIPLDHLKGTQLEIAERINTIGEGLDAAVEANMKNERLKTDLITNVSHDIKTPLTSIINYVDLLKRENLDDPKIQGYLDILEAKAQRLKALTEDVVEASKVSSGNISLECMNLNLVEMVQQTSGEFAEKFAKRGLKEVLNLPDEPAIIWADGRRMWRILENIYNNVAKYAMEETRVYADLKITDLTVEFSLKNISEQPLNISADELTERFIRGDVSRSTEGSGLGLSIAKNLAELMGGRFEIYLDGDLFRVTIIFPKSKYIDKMP